MISIVHLFFFTLINLISSQKDKTPSEVRTRMAIAVVSYSIGIVLSNILFGN